MSTDKQYDINELEPEMEQEAKLAFKEKAGVYVPPFVPNGKVFVAKDKSIKPVMVKNPLLKERPGISKHIPIPPAIITQWVINGFNTEAALRRLHGNMRPPYGNRKPTRGRAFIEQVIPLFKEVDGQRVYVGTKRILKPNI